MVSMHTHVHVQGNEVLDLQVACVYIYAYVLDRDGRYWKFPSSITSIVRQNITIVITIIIIIAILQREAGSRRFVPTLWL